MRQADSHVRAGRGAAGDQAAMVGKAGRRLLPGGRADVFDDDINPLLAGDAADFVFDALLVVVDDFVGTEILCLR